VTYAQTLDYLYSRLPMFQRIGPAAYKADLSNTIALCKALDNPQESFKSIHIAGTNGKGSTSHLLASVLQAAGYKTGLYTSPHLKDFRERIRVNGKMIAKEDVVAFVEQHKAAFEKIDLSFFEWTVGLAFHYFREKKVDIAIIETGLGGRLDSTNIILPEVSVITNISYDHMNLLGNTLEKIAKEKAGIIKRDVPVIIGESQPEISHVFVSKAVAMKAPITFADKVYSVRKWDVSDVPSPHVVADLGGRAGYRVTVRSSLIGDYQKKNFVTVIAVLEELRMLGWNVDELAMRKGFRDVTETTGLLGRWQTIGRNPAVITDTGHNEGGIREIITQLKHTTYKKLHMVIGVVNDKDPGKILALLPKNATYYFCSFDLPRAMNAEELQVMAGEFGLKGAAFPTVKKAMKAAKDQANKNDLIFVGGSTFVVAEAL
jgi:dihydrofolate synthase/folylpolyglutamate synthase